MRCGVWRVNNFAENKANMFLGEWNVALSYVLRERRERERERERESRERISDKSLPPASCQTTMSLAV